MEFNDLVIKSAEIDNLVKQRYPYDNLQDFGPICDGIINIEKYVKAKFKILWILKEPYDYIEDGKPHGGGWDLKETLNTKKVTELGRSIATLNPIIYTSFGILNDFCSWDHMQSITNLEIFETLEYISYINVKKLPGFTQSISKEIANAYTENKEILLKQIDVCEPDIIIGGSTLELFLEDLGIENVKMRIRCEGSFPYYIKGKQLFIAAYHPSSVPRNTSERNYCNDIIDTVKSLKELW
jgi:hypothetical protein